MGVEARVGLVVGKLLLGEGAVHGRVRLVLLEGAKSSSGHCSAQVLTWSWHEGGLLQEGGVA